MTALALLTTIGSYPRSMGGVPGEAFSNMGPPTVCILALTLLQVGLVLLFRARVTAWLDRPRPQRFTAWAVRPLDDRVPVALSRLRRRLRARRAGFGVSVPQTASLGWWLERPLWVVLPALLTYPCLRVFRRFEHR